LTKWIKPFQRKKEFKRNISDILSSGYNNCIDLYGLLHRSYFNIQVEKDKLIIETIIKDQFNDYITVPGTVEPISTIFLDAQEGGRVEEILIEEGSMLRKAISFCA